MHSDKVGVADLPRSRYFSYYDRTCAVSQLYALALIDASIFMTVHVRSVGHSFLLSGQIQRFRWAGVR